MKIHSILPLKGNLACREKWHVTPVYKSGQHISVYRDQIEHGVVLGQVSLLRDRVSLIPGQVSGGRAAKRPKSTYPVVGVAVGDSPQLKKGVLLVFLNCVLCKVKHKLLIV